ncbi:unnamed protein product, partial [Mycena citricolor]
LHFYADNTSALATIFDPKPRAGQLYAHQFHKAICGFLEGDPQRTVEIAWSPGHCNIEGNERADELAKSGTELAAPALTTRAFALRQSKERIQHAWRREWKRKPKSGHYAKRTTGIIWKGDTVQDGTWIPRRVLPTLQYSRGR